MRLTPGAARAIRMALSSVVAGAIGIGSNLLTALQAQGTITRATLLVAVLTGTLMVLKDLGAYLAVPPGQP